MQSRSLRAARGGGAVLAACAATPRRSPSATTACRPTACRSASRCAKGYFKEEGLNITGIISSAGGGTSLRNMLAGGGVPYGEVNPGVVVSAIHAGADLKIISDNVLTVAEFVWAVKPDSPIKTIKDLKGKKIGYTNPRSTSQALARMLLQIGGLQAGATPSS